MISRQMRGLFFSAGFSVFLALVLLLASGCGVLRRAALRNVAGVFSDPSGSNVFAKDDDPELIRQALPFALKTYEALLAANPKDRRLCAATAEAFVEYANAFVHEEADRLAGLDLTRAQQLRQRATKLYLRARGYALAGLALDYPDFEKRLREDPEQPLEALSTKDVALLFWAAAGWAGAIATDVGNMSLVAELSMVEAMMRRALALDEAFEGAMIHEFFITYEGRRSEAMGGSAQRAIAHFDRAVCLTQGQRAQPYVALASSVAVRKQDDVMFQALLNEALAVDPDAAPQWRLSNTLAQEKARWLLAHGPDLFLDYEEAQP